jgi:hypothetical protein
MVQEGDYFVFPGGGTMFPDGAKGYVQQLEKYIPLGTTAIRTALDIGCGVCSFALPLHLFHKLRRGIFLLSFLISLHCFLHLVFATLITNCNTKCQLMLQH